MPALATAATGKFPSEAKGDPGPYGKFCRTLQEQIPVSCRLGQNRPMIRTDSLRARLGRLLFPLLLACLAPWAHSQSNGEVVINAVDQYLRTQTKGLPGRVQYNISPLDNRTQLTPCPAVEAFLPPGAKLWGKVTVGVRCLGEAGWIIYVPAQVSVHANYLITARPLSPGQPLTLHDIATQSGDLASLPTGIVTDVQQAVGKTMRNAIGAGQPLRMEMLMAPLVIQQGQTVKILSRGPGFTVSSEGRAMNNAAEGQVAQARTATGQSISGVARPGGIIEIGY